MQLALFEPLFERDHVQYIGGSQYISPTGNNARINNTHILFKCKRRGDNEI
jgi:hypothetical protein